MDFRIASTVIDGLAKLTGNDQENNRGTVIDTSLI